MRKWTLLVACLVCFAAPARADTLFGIYAGYGSWHHDSTGDISSAGDGLDLEADLALGDDEDDVYYIELEHSLPLLPNIRAQHSSYGSDGAAEAGRTLVFNDLTLNPPAGFETDIFVEQTDLILYYKLLDSVVGLDVGIGARSAEGEVTIRSSLASTEVDFDETLPLLYTRVRMDLLGGWWASADVMGMSYDGNELLDGSALLGWQSPWGLGLEAGYRWVRLRLDEVGDIDEAAIDFQGPYAALNFRF